MIRNQTKIFGEPNHPDTVLATELLESDSLVVGAGNKGVKPLLHGSKEIVYIDQTGKVKTLSYNSPNMYLCTDSGGDLVFRPEEDFYNKTFSFGGSNQVQSVNFVENAGEITINSISHNLASGFSIISVSKSTNTSKAYTIKITFANPLVINVRSTCEFSIFLSTSIGDFDRLKIGKSTGLTDLTDITSVFVGEKILDPGSYDYLQIQTKVNISKEFSNAPIYVGGRVYVR